MIPQPIRYAGFWRRSTAYAIDAHIVALLAWLATQLLGGVAQAQPVDSSIQTLIDMGWLKPGDAPTVSALLQAQGASGSGGWFSLADLFIWQLTSSIYNIWFVHGSWQATPGKRWCKLRVIMAGGAPLTLFQSTVRHAACGLGWLTFGIGFLMAGFSREKLAIEDAVVGSRVVYRFLPEAKNPAIS